MKVCTSLGTAFCIGDSQEELFLFDQGENEQEECLISCLFPQK